MKKSPNTKRTNLVMNMLTLFIIFSFSYSTAAAIGPAPVTIQGAIKGVSNITAHTEGSCVSAIKESFYIITCTVEDSLDSIEVDINFTRDNFLIEEKLTLNPWETIELNISLDNTSQVQEVDSSQQSSSSGKNSGVGSRPNSVENELYVKEIEKQISIDNVSYFVKHLNYTQPDEITNETQSEGYEQPDLEQPSSKKDFTWVGLVILFVSIIALILVIRNRKPHTES